MSNEQMSEFPALGRMITIVFGSSTESKDLPTRPAIGRLITTVFGILYNTHYALCLPSSGPKF